MENNVKTKLGIQGVNHLTQNLDFLEAKVESLNGLLLDAFPELDQEMSESFLNLIEDDPLFKKRIIDYFINQKGVSKKSSLSGMKKKKISKEFNYRNSLLKLKDVKEGSINLKAFLSSELGTWGSEMETDLIVKKKNNEYFFRLDTDFLATIGKKVKHKNLISLKGQIGMGIGGRVEFRTKSYDKMQHIIQNLRNFSRVTDSPLSTVPYYLESMTSSLSNQLSKLDYTIGLKAKAMARVELEANLADEFKAKLGLEGSVFTRYEIEKTNQQHYFLINLGMNTKFYGMLDIETSPESQLRFGSGEMTVDFVTQRKIPISKSDILSLKNGNDKKMKTLMESKNKDQYHSVITLAQEKNIFGTGNIYQHVISIKHPKGRAYLPAKALEFLAKGRIKLFQEYLRKQGFEVSSEGGKDFITCGGTMVNKNFDYYIGNAELEISASAQSLKNSPVSLCQ